MDKDNIIIANYGEKKFNISFCEDFYQENPYLNSILLSVEYDEDVEEYQYFIKDLVKVDVITTGWFKALDIIDAKKQALEKMYNFIQIQINTLDSILSNIIDVKYDLITNK